MMYKPSKYNCIFENDQYLVDFRRCKIATSPFLHVKVVHSFVAFFHKYVGMIIKKKFFYRHIGQCNMEGFCENQNGSIDIFLPIKRKIEIIDSAAALLNIHFIELHRRRK